MAASNEQILAYLQQMGVDPGLFGTYGANDINASQRYNAGTGDYASWDWRNVPFANAMQAIQSDPTNNQYTVGIGNRFSTAGDNYGVQLDPSTGGFVLRAKVGNKDSVEVPYKQQPDGSWAPDWQAAKAASWDTNAGAKRDLRGMATVLGAAAGGYLANSAGLFGVDPSAAAGAASGASGSAIPGMTGGGWGVMDASLMAPGAFEAAMGAGTGAAIPGMSNGAWGMMDPTLTAPGAFEGAMASIPGTEAALGTSPYSVSGEGMKAGTGALGGAAGGAGTSVGGAASQMPSWQSLLGKGAGAIGSLLGGGSGSGGGSALGGLLGAGLGYLDAKNQPDSLTVKTEIDPRLAQYAYGANGTGGIAGAASNLMNQQLTGPNPLADAGKQISGMANTLPSYNDAVANNKSLWDYNPFVQQQTKAITDNATRNMLENIFPQIGSEANSVGGYGGSRQGIAQGLGISRLNQDLAPTIAKLGSDAFENSQNRALTGAGVQLNYGLNNQLQQAGLLGKGAEYQQQGSWAPIQNATNVMGALPGNSSRTEPLFNNPWANAIGGASLGSQIGGGVNWGSLLGNIGNLFGGGSGSSGGVSSGMTGMGTINWNDLFNGASLPPYRG